MARGPWHGAVPATRWHRRGADAGNRIGSPRSAVPARSTTEPNAATRGSATGLGPGNIPPPLSYPGPPAKQPTAVVAGIENGRLGCNHLSPLGFHAAGGSAADTDPQPPPSPMGPPGGWGRGRRGRAAGVLVRKTYASSRSPDRSPAGGTRPPANPNATPSIQGSTGHHWRRGAGVVSSAGGRTDARQPCGGAHLLHPVGGGSGIRWVGRRSCCFTRLPNPQPPPGLCLPQAGPPRPPRFRHR